MRGAYTIKIASNTCAKVIEWKIARYSLTNFLSPEDYLLLLEVSSVLLIHNDEVQEVLNRKTVLDGLVGGRKLEAG